MNVFEKLQKDGYCMLPQSIEERDIDKLIAIFNKYQHIEEKGFQTSFNLKSNNDKLVVDLEIKQILSPLLKKYFPGYTPLVSNFAVKFTGENSFLPVHRDWSVVDERKHQSISVWIPLVDLNLNNGAIGFIKESHLNANLYRGPSKSSTLFSDSNENNVDYLSIKRGEIVVFFPSTLHTSKPNLSSEIRIALTVVLNPLNVDVLHFYYPQKNDSIIQAFKVDKEFFLNYKLGDIPKRKVSFILKNNKQIKFPNNLIYRKWMK